MKKAKLLIAIMIATTFQGAYAHEGEDHDAPVAVKAPNRGSMKALEETFVEVLVKGKDIKIYLHDKKLSPKSVKGFIVTAKTEVPRTKKIEEVNLTAQENHYEGTFDAKSSHRYILHVAVKDPTTGHDDKMKFTIEPKK